MQKFGKKSWFLYVFSGTELFFLNLIMYTKLLHKKPVPLTLKQLWLHQTFFFGVCRCLNVHIFVPWLILNFNMFYKTVKCIRIEYLKSRKIFASWVLMPLKMGNMVFCLFLRPWEICQMLQMGIHAPKYFILGILLLWTLKDTFAKLWVLRTPAAPWTTFFSKKKVYFLMSITTKNDN